jgi:hypothetical protein
MKSISGAHTDADQEKERMKDAGRVQTVCTNTRAQVCILLHSYAYKALEFTGWQAIVERLSRRQQGFKSPWGRQEFPQRPCKLISLQGRFSFGGKMTEFNLEEFRNFEIRNYGRLEFLSIKPELQALLDRGLSHKGMYRYFKSHNRIRITYPTFTKYLRKYLQSVSSPATPVPQQAASIITQNSGPFQDQGAPPVPAAVPPAARPDQIPLQIAPLGQAPRTIQHDALADKDKLI